MELLRSRHAVRRGRSDNRGCKGRLRGGLWPRGPFGGHPPEAVISMLVAPGAGGGSRCNEKETHTRCEVRWVSCVLSARAFRLVCGVLTELF